MANLDFEKTLTNINLFKDEYKGKLCTETMIVNGINDSIENLSKLSELIKKLNRT